MIRLNIILIELMLITAVIHMIDTLAYSVRLNSVKSGQYALSLSLFNVFVLVSRTANTFLSPLVGNLTGRSIQNGYDPIFELRLIIFSATIGTIVGIFLIPTFLRIFSSAVSRLELTGSVPALIFQALNKNSIKRVAKNATLPKKKMIKMLNFGEVPKSLLFLNTLITGVYTVGIFAAFYSATMVSAQKQLAAAASSGMINGVATILLTLFVDPKAAIITDQALRGNRSYGNVKTLVILLIGTKLLGTLIGQLLLIPSAKIIAWFYM
jgi:uncharacterized membrane protein